LDITGGRGATGRLGGYLGVPADCKTIKSISETTQEWMSCACDKLKSYVGYAVSNSK